MTDSPIRVVKLGGSLLDLPGLRERLRSWLDLQTPAGTVLVVGGGSLADAIRTADRLHGLSAEAAHWLCIRAMSLNAHLMAELLPDAVLVQDIRSIRRACEQRRLAILDPWPFIHDEEPRLSRSPLPCSWDVTSDSVAARLAALLSACELVLLKSALPETGMDLLAAARAGYVDSYFRNAAAWLPAVRCFDLRTIGFPSAILR
ncbi:MAG: hypothetical protein HY000_06305 [Planctomycetes bacterium]|nr:hypothetical protein [Planctomycetota bacterium]